MTNINKFIDIFKNNIIDKSELINMNNKQGFQSKITFYKISDECRNKIFNQCSIELIDNIIIKKEFIDHKRYRHIQNNKQQFQNEINALLLLCNDNHFPKLLSYDDEEVCIYLNYCGEPLSSKNIPNDWKNQLKSIIIKLNNNKNIYHNDMMCRMNRNNGGNFCVMNNILYLIDFGWASRYKPSFPNQNITLKNMYFNKEYKKMLKYEKEKKINK